MDQKGVGCSSVRGSDNQCSHSECVLVRWIQEMQDVPMLDACELIASPLPELGRCLTDCAGGVASCLGPVGEMQSSSESTQSPVCI